MVGGAVKPEGLFVGEGDQQGVRSRARQQEMTAKYGDTHARKRYNETHDFIQTG